MVYWSTQHLFQLYFRKYPHSKDSFFECSQNKRRITLAVFLLFSPQRCLSRMKDDCDKTREAARCALIVQELKKVWGKKSEEGLSLGGRTPLVNFPLSHLEPLCSLHSVYGVVCDLSVRRVTRVLLIGLTPTDRWLTLERSGQVRLGTPATRKN